MHASRQKAFDFFVLAFGFIMVCFLSGSFFLEHERSKEPLKTVSIFMFVDGLVYAPLSHIGQPEPTLSDAEKRNVILSKHKSAARILAAYVTDKKFSALLAAARKELDGPATVAYFPAFEKLQQAVVGSVVKSNLRYMDDNFIHEGSEELLSVLLSLIFAFGAIVFGLSNWFEGSGETTVEPEVETKEIKTEGVDHV